MLRNVWIANLHVISLFAAALSQVSVAAPAVTTEDGELKIHFAQVVSFPSPGRDNLEDLWLMSDKDRYWIRARHGAGDPTRGCDRAVNAGTAARMVAVWKRAAPLLEKIKHEPETGVDITTYSFDGYADSDIQAKMPAYGFEKIQDMMMTMWAYCRKGSAASRRAMESSLSTLER